MFQTSPKSPLKKNLIHIALGCGAMLALATGCSDKNAPSKKAASEASLPSIVDEKPELTQIDTGNLEPDVAAEPVPEPTPAPPVLPETYAELVKVARSSDDAKLALEALDRARELKPNAITPDIESARIHLAGGDAASARPFIEKALESNSSSSYAWNTMGRVELAEGNLAAAVASFERATEENEDNAYAWNNLGYTLMRLDRLAEAATALEQATSAGKPTGYMFNNLGMVYERMGRMDLAGAAYRRSIELGSAKAQANLDRLKVDHPGETDPIEDATEEVIGAVPSDE